MSELVPWSYRWTGDQCDEIELKIRSKKVVEEYSPAIEIKLAEVMTEDGFDRFSVHLGESNNGLSCSMDRIGGMFCEDHPGWVMLHVPICADDPASEVGDFTF